MPLNEHKINLEPDYIPLSPDTRPKRNYGSRPHSNQRNPAEDLISMAPSYNAGGTRADQSALEHIRRIRRNMPSQQASRMSHDLSRDYLSAVPSNGGGAANNSSKIENYKRIK